MFGKLDADDSHLGTNRAPILTKEFWNTFIPLSVETLCKPASVTETDPPRAIDLGYKHTFMQQCMDSQLNDMMGTAVTKREINQRVKTQLQRLIPNLAENLTFNSLSPPSSFKKGFYSREPFEETGTWYSKLYQLTNQSFSCNLKGVFELYNEAIRKHNEAVLAKADADPDKTNDYDDQPFPLLKEEDINRSYWTHASGKGNILAFIEKGVFSNWPKMNDSVNYKNVPKNAKKW